MNLSLFRPNLRNTAFAAGGAIAGGLIGRQTRPAAPSLQDISMPFNLNHEEKMAIGGAVLGYVAGSLLRTASSRKRLSDGATSSYSRKLPKLVASGSWRRNVTAGSIYLYDYRLWKSTGKTPKFFIEINEGDVTSWYKVTRDIFTELSKDAPDEHKIEFYYEAGALGTDADVTIDNGFKFGKHKEDYSRWVAAGYPHNSSGEPDPKYFNQ